MTEERASRIWVPMSALAGVAAAVIAAVALLNTLGYIGPAQSSDDRSDAGSHDGSDDVSTPVVPEPDFTISLQRTGDDDASCEFQWFDLDQNATDLASSWGGWPDSADLIWDTCGDAWNLTVTGTESMAYRIDSNASERLCDMDSSAYENPVNWRYEPQNRAASQLTVDSIFCVRWSMTMATVVISSELSDGEHLPVDAEVTLQP